MAVLRMEGERLTSSRDNPEMNLSSRTSMAAQAVRKMIWLIAQDGKRG